MGIVPAVFGAAAGLAGLLLVFLGVSISAFQSFAGDAPAAATARFRRAGAWILGAFLLGLVTVAVSFAWLLSPHRALRDVAAVLGVVAAVVVLATVEGLILTFVARRAYNWQSWAASATDALVREYLVYALVSMITWKGIVTVTKYGRILGGRRDWRHEAAT